MISTQKHTILVVEDELPIQKAIRIKLKQEGFEVFCARGVQEAMRILKSSPKKQAIWLDHYLFGKEDGLDFVTKIKAKNSHWKRIPIFVVSNSASDEKVKSYIRLGVNKYFVKSEHPLAQIVNDILETLEKNEE
jgi:DNA-binding response OmpR family regulator